MSAPRIHRVTGDSKQGRRLRSQNARRDVGPGLTPEQIAWNARVEAERAARKVKRVVNLAAAVNKAYEKS